MKINKSILLIVSLICTSTIHAQSSPSSESMMTVAIQPILSDLIEAIVDSEGIELDLVTADDTTLAMLNGFTKTVVTKQMWTDSQVSAFEQQYGVRPIQLYFAVGPHQNNEQELVVDKVLAGKSTQADVYYVYTTSKELGADVSSDLNPFFRVVSNQQNAELFEEHNFSTLPMAAIHRNQIAIGLEEPSIVGGYK